MKQLVQPALIDGEERVSSLPADPLHLSFRRRGATLRSEGLGRSEWELDPPSTPVSSSYSERNPY
jgi:hypothetical protein